MTHAHTNVKREKEAAERRCRTISHSRLCTDEGVVGWLEALVNRLEVLPRCLKCPRGQGIGTGDAVVL